ncbi:PASTA domain-containing protein [Mycobacterium sp. 21AC1]|uniref:PASTA domain-containing protein n=1 Tax=[Mycobacterium] appelbergii TaxID=2939269 RepID=UPI002939382F|nr:PASTA domain-containing protein [Mycobacterium sp. 21AC1]MDV3126834.1 PASTA domain-containing protein [Mycobacterium sp. 21AC1]
MKKLLGVAAIAVGMSAIPVGMLATGIAAADDYAGQTYADASSALSDAGMKGVVATRSGDSLPDDKCVVESSEKAAWLKGDDFSPVSDTVLLHLNCNAGVATAGKPGNSAASPEGRAAIQQAKQDAADQAKAKH